MSKKEMAMIFIENESTDAAFNLALEECLFERGGDCSFVSLWRNSPSVIVGRYQNTVEEVNQNFADSNGIKIVRRATGGGAVYHDLGNLNYTIIKRLDADFDASYLPKVVAGSLVSMGLPAVVSGRNDILIEGKKISGHAQHASKNILLHHGTLLFDSDIDDLVNVLNVRNDKFLSKAVQSVRGRVSNIKPFLRGEYSNFGIADFDTFMKKFFTENFSVTESRPPNKKEIAHAKQRVREKYGRWDWNWGNSPPYTTKLSRRFDGGLIEFLLDVERGLVKKCTICGDFLGDLPADFLSKKLIDRKYPFEDLHLIEDSVFSHIFTGISPNDVRSLLVFF